MGATCYRCIVEGTTPPGEPFGACNECSALACITCGVRVPIICEFKCVTCYSSAVLLPLSGLGPGRGGGGPGPGGGGPGSPAEPHDDGAPYRSTEEFETLEPVLAESSRADRNYYHGDIDRFLQMAREYAFDEARREEIDQRLGYERYSDAVERSRRQDLLGGAQRLARDTQAAEAAGRLRRDLVADAFGVGQYAIGIAAGEEVPPERLAMLSDQRLRFIVGAAAAATGPLARHG